MGTNTKITSQTFGLLLFAISAFYFDCYADELPTCQPADFHWEYTECDSDGGRWRVQVPNANSCVGGAPKPPVRGVKCDIMCPKGQFLDVQEKQVCIPCEAGTFSLGGGVRFEDWETLPDGFTTLQEDTSNLFSEFINYEDSTSNTTNCASEMWVPSGRSITAVPIHCSSSIIYTADLVTKGKVRFLYQFEDNSGIILHFKVKSSSDCASSKQSSRFPTSNSDDDNYRFPPATDVGEWGEVEMELDAGVNTLEWKTFALSLKSTGNTFAKPIKIKSIEITGVAFTDQCMKCRAGTFSKEGSAECEECPPNTYSTGGSKECAPCDAKTEYSMPGADQCLLRPPCTEHDYFEYHTPCENNMTRTVYKWMQNIVCRKDLPESAKLPTESKPMPCPPCNPGMELGDDGLCHFCSDGMFSDGSSACQSCPGSTAPEYGYKVQFWNNLPLEANMSSTCIATKESCCKSDNSGWMTGTDNVQTMNGQCDSAFLVFGIELGGFRGQEQYIGGSSAAVAEITFIFEMGCGNDECSLIFMQQEEGNNLQIMESWEGTQEKTTYNLKIKSTSARQFTWAFQKKRSSNDTRATYSSGSWAKVYSVEATNTLDGGAVSCQQCPLGTHKEGCVPCPKNNYIDLASATCKQCPPGTIVQSGLPYGEEACLSCGEGLTVHSTEDADHCMTTCKYTSKRGREYDFTGLSGFVEVFGAKTFTGNGLPYFHQFNISLCGGSFDYPEASCYDNITNTARKYMKEHSNKYKDTATEVHAPVCRSTIIPPKEDVDITISAQPVSVGDVLVAVTTDGGSFNMSKRLEEEGFPPADPALNVEDVHFYYKTEDSTGACESGRSTIITLRCDPVHPDKGEIQVPPKCGGGTCDGCNLHFLWLTEQACPKCSNDIYREVKGACVDGLEQMYYIGPKYCPEKQPTHGQKCSILPFWLEVTIAAMCFVAVLLCVIVVYCWNRNKNLEYKYMKLVAPSGDKDAELPAAPTCALSEDEDEEEEEFDAVRFQEGKSKAKFFSKIKLGNKKGDNPFGDMSMSDRQPLT